MINKKFWKNKKVLITGHTGFKGGWLSIWMNNLGSKVIGYSINPITKKNLFDSTKIKKIFMFVEMVVQLQFQIILYVII